jgi:two-component sensor histidine kinase
MLVDITDRKRAEEHQALLIRELHHRVKNMLSTVQAIMASTARASTTIEEFQAAFTGRIASLARTHSALAESPSQNIGFDELLLTELDAYDDGSGNRIILDGPPAKLASSIAIPLGMALHELATNAVKHGALSVPGGCVAITWSVVDAAGGPTLQFEWVERNGPKVSAPKRRGFGSQLLERVLNRQVGADARLDYDPDGLRAQVSVSLAEHRPSTEPLDTLRT